MPLAMLTSSDASAAIATSTAAVSLHDGVSPRPPRSPGRSLPAPPNKLLLAAEAQWIFSEADLKSTPSVIAGLTLEQERDNRAKGVNFILQVGIMLKLPQLTLATAAVYLHRFFMRYPMIPDPVQHRAHQHYYSVAAACLFLATKVEENCRKMKDLVVACVRVAQKQPSKEVDEQDKEFWRWRDTILSLEDLLLEALCFDLSLDPPYTTLFNFLVYFGVENNKILRNAAWAFVNDSCLTPLCLLWPSRIIAAAALYAAARHAGVAIDDDPQTGAPWWEVMGAPLPEIRRACNFMAGVYENVPLKGSDERLYQRTPEDGDARDNPTRQSRPALSADDERRSAAGSANGAATAGTASPAASEVSRKRGRPKADEEGEVTADDNATNARPDSRDDDTPTGAKRRKPDSDHSMSNDPVLASTDNGGGLESPQLGSGSEEGEVEA